MPFVIRNVCWISIKCGLDVHISIYEHDHNSELEQNEMGARLIHHGGMVHLNCGTELLKIAGLMPDENLLAERGETLYGFLLKEFGEYSESP